MSKNDDAKAVKKLNKAMSDHTQAIFLKYQQLKDKGEERPMSAKDKEHIIRNCEGLVNHVARKFNNYRKMNGMYNQCDFEDL